VLLLLMTSMPVCYSHQHILYSYTISRHWGNIAVWQPSLLFSL